MGRALTWSAVVPVFNGMSYIDETLDAIRACGPDDVIVVDDASSDGSADHIASFHPEVRLIRHFENLRVTGRGKASRESGLLAVTTDAYVFVDQDDILVPEGVVQLVSTLDARPDAVAAVGDFRCFADSDRARSTWRDRSRFWPGAARDWSTAPFDLQIRLQVLGCWMIRTNSARRVWFSERLRSMLPLLVGQDRVFVTFLSMLGPVIACPATSLHYRVRSSDAARPEWALNALPQDAGSLRKWGLVDAAYAEVRRGMLESRGADLSERFWNFFEALREGEGLANDGRYKEALAPFSRAVIRSARFRSSHARKAALVGLASALKRYVTGPTTV